MKVFYGAAIQGARNRGQRSAINLGLIEAIKSSGLEVFTEHTAGKTREETGQLLEQSIGPLPKDDMERRIFIRRKMIEAIEGDLIAAVFEVSLPSLGTGNEIAHAYLRPRMNLAPIPVLALYQKDYWPNKLSTMIRGITQEEAPHFELCDYIDIEEAQGFVRKFLSKLTT